MFTIRESLLPKEINYSGRSHRLLHLIEILHDRVEILIRFQSFIEYITDALMETNWRLNSRKTLRTQWIDPKLTDEASILIDISFPVPMCLREYISTYSVWTGAHT